MKLKYKEVILMRYIQGLKYDEIAAVLDLPVGTIKNRLYKAKALLKSEIKKDGMFN
jgi:RNA polymerase sigma-70 factor (ECF subfamily)